MREDKPVIFKTLGKTLQRDHIRKPEFMVRMSDFAEYGYCPYTAWHLSQGTQAIHAPKIERAIVTGKIAHAKLDKTHEEKIAKLPKATKKTLLKKHRPLAFPRNLPVHLYHKQFLYVGRIDLVKRESDGNLYINDDKFTMRLPERPWNDHLLQVWAYCSGMSSTYWHKIDAKYLYWQVQYYANKEKTEVLGNPFGDFYFRSHHEVLLNSMENFEAIYMGKDLGFEVNLNKCKVCKFGHACSFKAQGG